MELVDFCKEYNILEEFQQALLKVVAYYKQHNTLNGMNDIDEEFGQQEGDRMFNFRIYIYQIQPKDVEIIISNSEEDLYGELTIDANEIQETLSIDQVRVMNMYIEFFGHQQPRHSKMGL